MSILFAIIIFGIIVVIHELGHFWAARKSGILVEEFSVGMGPRILKIQRGETLYSLKLIPLGGSCRMLGEDGENADPRSFNSKPIAKRILVITAGVIMNLILAMVTSSIIVLFNGYSDNAVGATVPGAPADGVLLAGDRIVEADGVKINIYNDFLLFMYDNNGSPIDITILRNGEQITKTLTPAKTEEGYKIGVYPQPKFGFFTGSQEAAKYTEAGYERAGLFESFKIGYENVVFSVKSVVKGLFRMVTLKFNANEMAGPIGLTTVIGEKYQEGVEDSGGHRVEVAIWTILNFVMLLSANLAVINLLPLPALDGGRLIFLLIEAVRKKPVNREVEGMIHFAGFVLLMVLAVFIAYNDIIKII